MMAMISPDQRDGFGQAMQCKLSPRQGRSLCGPRASSALPAPLTGRVGWRVSPLMAPAERL